MIDDADNKKKDIHFWLGRIRAAGKLEEQWITKANKYCEKYLNANNQQYNIFYSNTELLKSALLPQIPEIAVMRRFAKEQAQDPKEKQFHTTVSEIVERAVTYNVKNIHIEKEFEAFKYDYLITGRGVLWASFEGEVEGDEVVNGKIILEHVHYKDFRMSSGKNWKEVWWIARRHKLNRTDLVRKFGNVGKHVELNYTDKDAKNKDVEEEKLAEVWEIWDKTTKKLHFVSTGYDKSILESSDDPYKLDGFFPTPEPLRSIIDPNSMIPTPELDLYLKEADDLTVNAERIADIVASIKPIAFYAARFGDIVEAIAKSADNEYVGVTQTESIEEIGGMQNLFCYPPIEAKQAVAAGLSEQQQSLIQNIYEITGISDIMRNIAPQETATATLQKGRFGSLRLQERQTRINNYVKSLYEIATEMVCELFSIRDLQEITSMQLPTNEQVQQYQMQKQMQQQQYQQQMQQVQQAQARGMQVEPPPPPPVDTKKEKFFNLSTWEQIKEFLQNNRLRSYLIDIETSFNLYENEEQAQRSRVDLLNVFGESVAKALPIISQMPSLAEAYFETISLVIDSFRISRTSKNNIEDGLSQVIEDMRKAQEQPPSQEPDPNMLLGQAEMMKGQAELQKAKIKEREVEIKAQELPIKVQELQLKMKELELEAAKIAEELQIDKDKLLVDTQVKGVELQLKDKEINTKGHNPEGLI